MNVPLDNTTNNSDDLLLAVAEHLKLPLLHIFQYAELAKSGIKINVEQIENISSIALRLIDGYVLSRQLTLGQTQLDLEPVAVSSVLQDSAHTLSKIAGDYSCRLELSLSGKYGPVMAHRLSLESAMVMLGYAFIEAQQDTDGNSRRIVLAAHRGRHGIATGIYGHQKSLSADMFKRAKVLYGRSYQPVPALGHGSGAGVFLADKLLKSMNTKLYVSRHSKLTGLAAVFVPSPQLQLLQ